MTSRPSTPTPPSNGSPMSANPSSSGISSPPSSSAVLSIEEREKRLAEERIQQALRLQRKQRLEQLIHKRKANVEYLKKLHQGGVFWLNVTLFTQQDIRHYVRTAVPKQRVESFFLLGMSISTMLVLNPGVATVRAFAQLIEEWEYFHAGTAMQSVKYVMAKNSPCIYPHTVVHIAFELDYVEVLVALCDVLYKLYDKLFHPDCFTNQVAYDTIIRLDTRIKHHVINMIAKEFTEMSDKRIRLELNYIRSLTEKKIGETPSTRY